jgi:hypothetical protein
MANHTDPCEPVRTISFWRLGPNAFDGKFFIRGTRFEDFLLTSSVGRITQNACDAVKSAIARLEAGTPDAYQRVIEALNAVSSGVVADWL